MPGISATYTVGFLPPRFSRNKHAGAAVSPTAKSIEMTKPLRQYRSTRKHSHEHEHIDIERLPKAREIPTQEGFERVQ